MAGVGLGVLDGQAGQVERGELVAAAVDLAQVRVFRHVERGELVVLAVERCKLREVLNAGQVGDAEVAAVELRHMAQLKRRELAVAVDVLEAARVDLVDDGLLPPVVIEVVGGHADSFLFRVRCGWVVPVVLELLCEDPTVVLMMTTISCELRMQKSIYRRFAMVT